MNIFLDIDNTICTVNEAHGAEKYTRAIPIPERIAHANKLFSEGNRITYWTARGKASGKDYTELTRQQLDEWGCKYHELRMDKPSYDLYIDDKSQNTLAYFDKGGCGCACTTATEGEKVQKGWGYEFIITNNEKYCGKILHFHKHAKFSMHFHMKKTETWYVYSGKFEFLWIDTKTADMKSKILNVGDIVTNEIGQPHQLVCLEEGDIFEVSTQHFDSDSYRVAKGDSQHTRKEFENLLFLIHLGLGDHIVMAPAVAFLAKQTKTLYIPCKKGLYESVNAVYSGLGNITLLPIHATTNEMEINMEINKHIEELGKKGPLVVAGTGGYCKHPNPVYPFPSGFYKDLGLDFMKCKKEFTFTNIPTTFTHLLSILKQLEIPHVFVHSVSSTKDGNEIEANVHTIKTKYGNECILLNPDKNMYPPNHPYYYFAQIAVRRHDQVITEYIQIMESAREIHVIDSCYFSLSAFINTHANVKTVYKRANVQFVWLESDSSWNQVVLS